MSKKKSSEIIDIGTDNTSKRKPKTKPELDIQLNEEQKEAKRIIMQNDIIVLFGKPGSGKTILSTNYALDAYFNREINKIHITRPMVTTEDMGFLPGNISEKMNPYLLPLYDNFKKCYGSTASKKTALKNMIENEDIEITPLAFMRGRHLQDAVCIVDECQNITIEQVMMIIGRLGTGSKIIFCGDYRQIDLKKKSDSGLEFLIKHGDGIQGFATFELTTNHRHPILDHFMERFDKYQENIKK